MPDQPRLHRPWQRIRAARRSDRDRCSHRPTGRP
jgi:hypothetical protein